MPSPTTSFDGLHFTETCTGGQCGQGHPPDPNGDVGPTYYIETINVAIGIYNKSTGARVAGFTFDDFMSQGAFGNLCDADNFGDPVVVYDSFHDRWGITDFAFQLDNKGNVVNPPGSYQCFAVSRSGNPVSGGWNFYSLHLTDALHAWGGVHLLRDLKGLYDFEPGKQEWASRMAGLLIEARDAASAARQAGESALDAAVLEDLVSRYRALAAAGLAANLYRRTVTAKDARRLARRFLSFEDLILRLATRPDLDIFSNNEAERTIRPVKVQQRSSSGSWRTLDGPAEFAIIQSCLSTAAKWGISTLDDLRDLFSGNA